MAPRGRRNGRRPVGVVGVVVGVAVGLTTLAVTLALARIVSDATERALQGPPTTPFVFDPRSVVPPPGTVITAVLRPGDPGVSFPAEIASPSTSATASTAAATVAATPPVEEPGTVSTVTTAPGAGVDQPPPTFEPHTIGDVTVRASTIRREANHVNFQFEFGGPTGGDVTITWTDTPGVAPTTRSFTLNPRPDGLTVSLVGLAGATITLAAVTAGGSGELVIPVT